MNLKMVYINKLFLVKEDNVKCGHWPLARVAATYPRQHNHVGMLKGTYK